MTTINYISDLHLEHYHMIPDIDQGPSKPDLTILAGDIANGVQGVEWAAKTFDHPVIYVPGNHEFYGHDFDALTNKFAETRVENVHVLQDFSKIVLHEGIAIIGGTLWTDFELYGNSEQSMKYAKQGMSCFRRIQGFSPERSAQVFEQHKKNLMQNIVKCWTDDAVESIVVISHHLPSLQCVDEYFRYGHGQVLNPAYASNLDMLVDSGPTVWVHGHTHHKVDIKIGDCRVLCNPSGYPGEKYNQRQVKTFEV